ncbi:hypothetical protein [Ureaplasma ceti]|uniref:Uncharacterized protein n=1 Tax=Ureaplasma ceti TaxID=3119530 RepID=A0ABP9U7F3_9BACT
MSKKDSKKAKKVEDNASTSPNTASNAFLRQMKQNIQQKMKTDQRKDVDLEAIKQQEIKQQEEEKAKEVEKKGVKVSKPYNKRVKEEASNWKEILKRTALGGVSAACSVVPGSSSTVLTARTPQLHDKMTESFAALFKPRSAIDWWWNFLWMLPFLVVFILVFVLAYYIYFKIQQSGYGISMVFLFIGISIFTAPLIYFMTSSRPKFAINRQEFYDQRDENKKPGIVWLLFVLGFFLIIGIAFVARFAWVPNSFPISAPALNSVSSIQGVEGIDLKTYSDLYSHQINTAYAFQILFASFLCGICMLIPGLSGSFMLGVLGSNGDINAAIWYGFHGYTTPGVEVSANWAWSTIIISFIGCFLGIVASLFFIRYMKRTFENGYKALVLGMYFASMIAIFIAISNSNYYILGHNKNVLGCSLGLLFASSVPAFLWMVVWQRLGFVDMKWLRFVGTSKFRVNLKK